MAGSRRSAKACERCRNVKRRCRPPYPCQACVKYGHSCVVRDKARPRRIPRERIASASQTSNPSAVFQDPPSQDPFRSFCQDKAPVLQPISQAEEQSSRDPLEIVVYLVHTASMKRYNYDFNCHLVEPGSSRLSKDASSDLPPQANPNAILANLDHRKIQQMIGSMEQLKDSPIDLVDLSRVQSLMASIFMDTPADTTLLNIDVGSTRARQDDLALAFAALTFEAFTESNNEVPLAFHKLSMKSADDYVGPPTLNLALANFLQHIFVLRIGTSNRSRALAMQAVQAAHDVGINKCCSSHNSLQTARLYLALYFTDQYCAMTHNTAPCIRPTDYDSAIFEPLRQASPELKHLVELVALNGKVLDKMHASTLTYDNVIGLESLIGKACFTLGQPLIDNAQKRAGFEGRYANLAYIHMFWLRIMLRTPLLMSSEHWLSSLTICIHAAQMMLSLYFDIVGPSIQAISQSLFSATDQEWPYTLTINQLPPTWRQVRRIMTSILILFYGFLYGEVSYDDAGRACAYALALLEFERLRWGDALNDSRRSILSLAAVCGVNSKEYIMRILPGADGAFIAKVLDAEADHIWAQAGTVMDQQADDTGSAGLQDLNDDSSEDILSSTTIFSGVFPPTELDFQCFYSANLGGMEEM